MISVEEMLKSWVLASFLVLFSPIVKVLIPTVIRNYLSSFEDYFFRPQFTVIIGEKCDLDSNRIFEAATTYLRAKVCDSNKCLEVRKTISQKKSTIDVVTGEEIIDCFENIKLKWKFSVKGENRHERQKFIELSFDKKFKNVVLDSYLPYVITSSETIKEKEKVLKLYSRPCSGCDDEGYGEWSPTILEHPATFEKLAMDPEVKKMIKDDLDRFVRRKELYKKVGKSWKRGYLVYGPPGTGKSSLIAAMANYLKFNIYFLNLSDIYSDSELRSILLSTSNRSMLVTEDIDCGAQLEDPEQKNKWKASSTTFTLSSLLNIIDGLWSSCGEQRIIVFTTNDKDKLDPALLRPGHMDVHVHMSYCTIDGFKLLATNYLKIEGDHQLYRQIEGLLKNVEVTPAEIAGELLKSGGTDVVLQGVVEFLEQREREKAKAAGLKELWKSADIDVDAEGLVKFLKQKNLEAAETEQLLKIVDTDVDLEGLAKFHKQKKLEAAETEQLLKIVDTDVDLEGLVKIFKQKKFEDAKAAEAKCINPNKS